MMKENYHSHPNASRSITTPDSFQRVNRLQRIHCLICGKVNCRLRSHARYLESKVNGQGFRDHDLISLLSSSFTSSYCFNPLSVALNYVCGVLKIDLDSNELCGDSSLPASMHRLIAYDIAHNTPFTDPAPNSLPEVAGEWLVAASVDELACVSTLHLWTLIQWTNTRNASLEKYASKLTSLFLELLRKRVEEGIVTPGTIFAASNHLAVCLIFMEQTDSQREVMMNGLEALVNANGGFESLTDTSNPGLLQSLLWSDVMYSCFTGVMARFPLRSPPPMPHSLIPERSATSMLPHVYRHCCSPELLETARYLNLFLQFRHGTETRLLSKDEYRYLVLLERWCHKGLLDQAGRYHDTATINEVIALALSLTRMSVLCIWNQHRQLRRMLGQRLNRALSRTSLNLWLEADAAKPLIWSCWVLLTVSDVSSAEEMALNLCVPAVKNLEIDVVHPRMDWLNFFSNTVQPLLWHTDWNAHVPRIARLISRPRTI